MGRPARARKSGGWLWRICAPAVVACASLSAFSIPIAFAQGGIAQQLQRAQQPGQSSSKMLVEANQLVYDNDNNKVSAVGNAQVYYEGKTLEADRIVYDRASKRVFAVGNVRMSDDAGTVSHGSRFELTDNFRDGFIESLRVESTTVVRGETLKVRFAAPRAERSGGETTIFERGTYTACEPCKDNPERPPFWQVKATKIIHNSEERTIYYENASVEIYGYPVAWLPYFWSPDNTVRRKTGFLAPRLLGSSALGYGVSLPFFWAIAPNYDLTFTPTYLTRQGAHGAFEWRHRLVNGSYNIRASGIFQQDKSAFQTGAYGPGDKTFRGALESAGTFFLSDRWRFGWNATMQTDKWYIDHYQLGSVSIQQLYFRDAISTVYLRGQGDRSFFDARGYYFQPLTSDQWQKQQPIVGLLDYNKRWNLAGPVGGEVGVDVNVTEVNRQQSAFGYIYRRGDTLNGVPLDPRSYPPLFSGLPYEGCVEYVQGRCLVRGVAGNHARATAILDWRRQFIDPIGQSWTPFASLRLDGVMYNPTYSNVSGQANNYAQMYVNSVVPGATNSDNTLFGRAMPLAGLTYRYPFVATAAWGTHIIEPIAQIIARPNETQVTGLPNNDAQSLSFDDTTLFETNKFSGYDRVEGGVRANVGVQYTFQGVGGSYANLLFGQSYQLAGRNSYLLPDLANVGLESGLDKDRSDFVGRAIFAPNSNFSVMSRARFDQRTFALQRLEAGPTFNFNFISGSILYARYDAQPELGYAFRREGILLNGNLRLNTNWSVSTTAIFDNDRYIAAREAITQGVQNVTGASSRAALSTMAVGLQYKDECTIFSVQYVSSGYRDIYSGVSGPSRAIYVKLELRSLGEVGFSQGINSASGRDGVATQ